MLFAVFDTETTGLPSHRDNPLTVQPRIIEFAGLITDGIEVIDTLEFVCNPGVVIEEIITEITGLKNEGLQGKPDFGHFIPEMKKFFAQADASIAHNHAFDYHMVLWDLVRRDFDMSDIAFPPLMICTVEQTFHQYGRRMRLQELYGELVGPYVQKHRALDDVRLLHEVAQRLGVYESFLETADA